MSADGTTPLTTTHITIIVKDVSMTVDICFVSAVGNFSTIFRTDVAVFLSKGTHPIAVGGNVDVTMAIGGAAIVPRGC
jgi:hypothetical protein